MSRSGYSEDCDDERRRALYRAAVANALRGKRGQAFLREMLTALDVMPVPALIADDLERSGMVCAIGAAGQARGIDMSGIDVEDAETLAATFGIATCMVREIVYENDEACWSAESPTVRWLRMRAWVQSKILER